MTFQEQTDQIRTSVHLLNVLPVRILKPITSTKTVKKADMVADLAFNLDFHGITVTESVLDADFLVFKFNGEKVGAIDVRRGRQEFQLPSGVWSTEWDKFFVYLIIQKRAIASRLESVKPKAITLEECDEMLERAVHSEMNIFEVPGVLVDEYALIDDESGTADLIESHYVNSQQARLTVRTVTADEAYEWLGDKTQDEYEDATDQSLSDDERAFIREFGELADNILSQIGRTDRLELIRDDKGEFRIVDEERDHEPIIWTNADTRLWGTSVYSWGSKTPNPLEHLTDYVNNIS